MLSNKTLLENSNLYSEIDDTKADQVAGGQTTGFTVVLENLGPIRRRRLHRRRLGPNPTGLQITNNSELRLNYELFFDGSRNRSIRPGQTQTFFGQSRRARAEWDGDLAERGIQLSSRSLQPGNEYAFRVV